MQAPLAPFIAFAGLHGLGRRSRGHAVVSVVASGLAAVAGALATLPCTPLAVHGAEDAAPAVPLIAAPRYATAPNRIPAAPPEPDVAGRVWAAGALTADNARATLTWLAAVPGPTGDSSDTVIVTERDDGRSLNLRHGERLQVVVSDNAGTGYSWQIERVDQRLLQPEGQRTWRDPGPPPLPGLARPVGLVGGPLQITFVFRAMAAGEGELVLKHWRPWEGSGSVDRRVRLRLRVLP